MLAKRAGLWRPPHQPSLCTIPVANSLIDAPAPVPATCQRMRKQSSGLNKLIWHAPAAPAAANWGGGCTDASGNFRPPADQALRPVNPDANGHLDLTGYTEVPDYAFRGWCAQCPIARIHQRLHYHHRPNPHRRSNGAYVNTGSEFSGTAVNVKSVTFGPDMVRLGLRAFMGTSIQVLDLSLIHI